MLEGFLSLEREYDMLPPGSRVLCAVSGGADSMCLLHLLHTLSRQRGFVLLAAHFDHRLRGEESRRDAAFVANWCREAGIFCRTGEGDVAAQARMTGQGIEETARAMRYTFLENAAQALGADRIATAHNADDNAETLLLHLIRGSGLQGLTGISPRRGALIRPLLTTSRSEIETYLVHHQVPHVEDRTNADPTYERNFLRHQVIPLLKERNPQLIRRMGDTARSLRQDQTYLAAQAAPLLAGAEESEGGVAVPIGPIAQGEDPIALRAVRQLLAMTAGGDTDCSAAHLRAILALCRSQRPSGQLSLPGGRTARRVYDTLLITPTQARETVTPVCPVQGENTVPGSDWTVLLTEPPWPGLILRHRQAGDKIALPGRRTKTLKKLFVDEKVPRWDRERLIVAADGDGVIAVAGFGPNTVHPKYGHTGISFIKNREEG